MYFKLNSILDFLNPSFLRDIKKYNLLHDLPQDSCFAIKYQSIIDVTVKIISTIFSGTHRKSSNIPMEVSILNLLFFTKKYLKRWTLAKLLSNLQNMDVDNYCVYYHVTQIFVLNITPSTYANYFSLVR